MKLSNKIRRIEEGCEIFCTKDPAKTELESRLNRLVISRTLPQNSQGTFHISENIAAKWCDSLRMDQKEVSTVTQGRKRDVWGWIQPQYSPCMHALLKTNRIDDHRVRDVCRVAQESQP
jgi:hypothetical protein